MSEKKTREITPSSGGFFQDIYMRIKLIMRLMGDNRVSTLLKLIPVGTLVYLLFPDIAPGPVDDAALIWLGAYLFVELCPPDVVEEHMRALGATIPAQGQSNPHPDEDVVDAEYKEE